ncbi:MAG: glycosyltransferase family 4 protein [Sedimentisphaerales bacterium]|nr:glycosyltransferase family 4 protein [Sedimentisphaerales bacterium]
MKICQISTVHPLNDNRVFHKECRTLVRAGHNVTLIITHDRNEKLEGINIVALKKRKNRLSRMVLGTFEALCYALKEKADVYHFHDPELIPAGILLKLAGKKVVYDVHENTSQQILNKEWLGGIFTRRMASCFAGFAEGLSKIFFDVIIAARPDIAEHWNCSKVRVVINAAALETIDKAPEIEISKPRAVVIYAGGLTYIRGIKQLIEAMEIIGDKAQLWLIGKWEDEKFKAECEKLPGFKHVKSLGYMIVGQVYSYMKKSDIAVVTFLPVPNHLTTLPNKPFEYMACCLPVIMSDFEYWKKIFGENVLYANPKSSEQIAKQIEKLLNDKSLRQILGQKGRKLVEEKYSWEAESKKLFEIYNSLAKL